MATAKKRKTVKRVTKIKKASDMVPVETSIISDTKEKKVIKPFRLAVVIIIVVLALLVYRYKNVFVAGMVNNQPITTIELNNRMSDAYGKQVLDQIITEKLLLGEANSRNISVSQSEINEELTKVESNLGGMISLDEALKQQGMTKDQLIDQVRLRIIVTKLVDNNAAVTDDEVNKYMEANKEYMGDDANSEKAKNDIRNYLKEQKVNEQIQTLIRELKEKAKIVTFI
ncbi:SurA N-terminal domain-containing protein [Candidatus Gottesmanbacteria bacterium]|nr:SurA N-terminal domain-containing protein [Candidatus Gottesmanbacteria bacterium]